MDPSETRAIQDALKAIASELAPDVSYVAKYGGEVFAAGPWEGGDFVGGIFSYRNHVSLEFSKGAFFDDPGGHLEGGGKMRRHLKLQVIDDVKAKSVRSFLRQAFAGQDTAQG